MTVREHKCKSFLYAADRGEKASRDRRGHGDLEDEKRM